MRKFLTIALALGAVASMSAQKTAVDAAKKLSGKLDKVAEARAAIKPAFENPETASDPNTYFVAGKIEFDAFEKANAKSQTDKNYVKDDEAMGRELLDGYDLFLQAANLEAQTGKNKIIGNIFKTLASRQGDYWNSGAYFFNNKKFPEAYKAFYDFGEIATNVPTAIQPDSTIAMAYNNAGIAAYSANDLMAAIDAFKKARATNAADASTYTYEIACWQNAARGDSTLADKASENVFLIAQDGLAKFGTKPMFFLNNVVSHMVDANNYDEAIAMVNQEIEKAPDNADIYGLRAFVNDRAGKTEAVEADYRKSLALGGGDFDTLRNAAIFLFKKGTEQLNLLEGNSPEVRAKKQNLKENYFLPASEAASKAKKINPNDGRLDSVIDSIDYAIATYFN